MTADAKTGTWVIDLDGVIWLATQPIPGSSEAVAKVRAAGVRVLFCTNNAATTSQALIDRLAQAGITAGKSDLISSAQAAASLLDPGSKAFVCGEKGILEALASRGVEVVTDAPAGAAIVGWTRSFDFDLLAKSMSVVGSGARLIGTNEDPTYPTPSGLIPGAGSILAAVAKASQTEPLVAGKPYGPMADLVRHTAPDLSLVVGDRPSTDGLFAKRLGAPFALVLSGVTPADHGTLEQVPDFEAADLSDMADLILGK
jgi:HAD superfamily hydrolase (TIGR01450 family)